MNSQAENKFRTVGILGGMGPEATVLLMSRIITATHVEDDKDHIPLLIDHNPQVPSRIKAIIEGQGENPGLILADMARRLAFAGVKALAMPCNTAHFYTSYIEKAVNIPLINMVDLTVLALAKMPLPFNAKVGMLVSPAVEKAKVYHKAFQQYQLSAVFPLVDDGLLGAIQALKRNAHDKEAIKTQQAIADKLVTQGCDVLLIACTELSLIADTLVTDVCVLDSLDVLVQAICDFSHHEKIDIDSIK